MSTFLASILDTLGTACLLRDINSLIELIQRLDAAGNESEGTDLLELVKDLQDVINQLDAFATRERRTPSRFLTSPAASDLVHIRAVLESVTKTAEECIAFIGALHHNLEQWTDEKSNQGYVDFCGQLQDQAWHDEALNSLRIRTGVFRVLLSATTLLHHKSIDERGDLSNELRSIASTLHYQIALTESTLYASTKPSASMMRSAITAAKSILMHVPTSTNKHFCVVRSVKSFYTGRDKQMATLKAAFEDNEHPGQKRFVIYGIGGSGKTELALKYAEEQQGKYWGVFFIDGSSRKNAAGTYAEIAAIGGVEPNEKAAKNWLMTRDLSWLLIIDNIDDDEVVLDELLPPGNKGFVLITSRDPAHRTYGNVGSRFVELQLMEREEATELILKAAEEPSPWTHTIKDSANIICHALGYLPLALVHAAKAILLGLCSWSGNSGYLSHYERETKRIHRERLRHRDQSRDRSSSRTRRSAEDDEDSLNVFSSYEILYQSLESSQEEKFRDAVELLHVFSYLHFQNINLDILVNAALNPFEEAEQRRKEMQEEAELQNKLPMAKRKSWVMRKRELMLFLRSKMETPPPLPSALRNTTDLDRDIFEDEVHIRVRKALSVLVKRSLIMEQDRFESRFSMHPLVHKWIRDRLDMSTSHQSLWCQMATTTLAKSILLPPLGDTQLERSKRRELLSHINHVRDCQSAIVARLEENRKFFKPFWPGPRGSFGRLQADEAVRFSRVYSECGNFSEALHLQSKTLAFLFETLGEEHPLSVKLTLFASGTMWELSRPVEATKLQRRALSLCMETLGEDHPLSLEVAESLGSALYLKGRWAESFKLHTRTIDKFGQLYGKDDVKTLKATRNLARLHYRYLDYDKATELHYISWEGMKKQLGETDLETLVSLEDYAMSFLRHVEENPDPRSTQRHLESLGKMQFVLEERRKILGKEHPYTLLAYFYFAQLKSALGKHEEAERMVREGITIAERNIGEEHTAVLMVKSHYARILVELGRCQEAEKIFRDLIHRPIYRKTSDEDGDHPDRIATLWFLTGCLEKQGRLAEALEVCKDIITALREIGNNGLGTKHKLKSFVQNKITELGDKLGNSVPVAVVDDTPSTIHRRPAVAITWKTRTW